MWRAVGRFAHLLPAAEQARTYQRAWLLRDVSAGLVLVGLLAPAGMAYATAAGLPPVTGLYATIVPLLVYALVGPSRIMVLGPDSSLAPLIAAVVVPLAAGDPDTAIAVGSMLSIIAGLVCVAAGLARFGFIAELLSAPVRYGYLHGIALTIIVSQTAKLCGFSVGGETIIGEVADFAQGLGDGKFNGWALLVGGTCVAVLVLLRWLDRRIPAPLAVVILGIVMALVIDLGAKGVKLVGDLPKGLPTPALPDLDWTTTRGLVSAALGVALVSFADTSVLSRTYAARTRSYVDPNQEMIGLGAANLAAGFFQGFPISSSSSRTPVAEAAGAKTQLTGVVGALAVALLLVFAPDLLRNLPTSALAAVVIASAIGLFEFADLRRIFRIQRWEFWLSIGCFVGVAVLGAIPGIGLAVVAAIIEFLWDGWRPHFAVMGRVDGIRGYHDIKRYPRARRVPGLVLFRWDAPLFFANAELFRERVLQAVADSPTPVRRIIVSAEPVTSVDVTSADVLAEMEQTLRESGIELHFAEMKDPVKDKLRRFELMEHFGPDVFHPTLGAAVDDYLADHAVDWQP